MNIHPLCIIATKSNGPPFIGIQLTAADVKANPGLRTIAKLMLNRYALYKTMVYGINVLVLTIDIVQFVGKVWTT